MSSFRNAVSDWVQKGNEFGLKLLLGDSPSASPLRYWALPQCGPEDGVQQGQDPMIHAIAEVGGAPLDAAVALHVNLDKTLGPGRETFTAQAASVSRC